jgi:hypothetical protein
MSSIFFEMVGKTPNDGVQPRRGDPHRDFSTDITAESVCMPDRSTRFFGALRAFA